MNRVKLFLVFWKVHTKKHTAKLFFGTVHGDENHCARYLWHRMTLGVGF
jgi:hypothetical protein